MDELPRITRYATCHFPGCANAGASIEVSVLAPPGVSDVACGVCGEQITDILDTKPTINTEVPDWLT